MLINANSDATAAYHRALSTKQYKMLMTITKLERTRLRSPRKPLCSRRLPPAIIQRTVESLFPLVLLKGLRVSTSTTSYMSTLRKGVYRLPATGSTTMAMPTSSACCISARPQPIHTTIPSTLRLPQQRKKMATSMWAVWTQEEDRPPPAGSNVIVISYSAN